MPSAAKAIALFSGGLDSYLATFLVQEQGIDVEAVKFLTVFGQTEMTDSGASQREAEILARHGVNLRILSLGREWLDIVARPSHGRGRNMNPCIDCRILMLKKAGEYMRKTGGAFIVTGEVLGQRPLSQNSRALEQVEKESGLAGVLLRPLSARLLPETEPEKRGLLDRKRLLGIRGRGRKEQFDLARRYGLENPPTPAGGCLLTDPAYSERLRSVLSIRGFINGHLARVIRYGRFFRLADGSFLVVGRNERDNSRLLARLKPGERLFEPENCVGPVGIGVGRLGGAELAEAARIIARYSDSPADGAISVAVRRGPKGRAESVLVGREGLI